MLELLFQWSSRDLCDLTGAAWDHVLVREKSGQVSYSQMAAGVKVNKLPGTLAICRKDQLWNNYRMLQSKCGQDDKELLQQQQGCCREEV